MTPGDPRTGDKVLGILVAKVGCCLLLTLSATGSLGLVGAWVMDGGALYLGLALVAAIAWTTLAHRRHRPARDAEGGGGRKAREGGPPWTLP